jgi:hypothetical protein
MDSQSQAEIDLNTISLKFTQEILRTVVLEHFKRKRGDSIAPEIISYKVNYGSGKGDGYVGIVYKIEVNVDGGITINLIAKGMPGNLARRKTLNCEKFFKNEILFYETIVPAFLQFEKEQLGGNFKCSLLAIPDCYFAISDGMNDFLVLEDLGDSCYSLVERSFGLNTEQTIEVLLLFARFHAFSLAMKHVEPQKFKSLTDLTIETLFHRTDGLWTDRYLAMIVKYFKSAVKSELENTKYLEQFEKFTKPEIFFPKIFYTVETRDSKSVINHGDIWVTNFMFKDLAAKAIDFQLVRYGSLVLDLSTLIFSCTDLEQRNKLGGIEGILALYQRELNCVVTSLGAPEEAGMSMEELLTAWRQFGAHGFGYSIELVQVSLIEDTDIEDLDRFDDDQTLTLADILSFTEIKTTEGRKRLVNLLKCAVDEGLI